MSYVYSDDGKQPSSTLGADHNTIEERGRHSLCFASVPSDEYFYFFYKITDIRKVQCPDCGYMTTQKSHLTEHINIKVKHFSVKNVTTKQNTKAVLIGTSNQNIKVKL